MSRRFIVLLIITCLASVGLRVLAQDSPVVGGDDASLRAFIERYVNPSGLSQPFTVNIAALPSEMPFELALPPNVSIVGSVARIGEDGKKAYEITLSGSTPAEVLTFFTQTYSANGWQVIQADDFTAGGFSTTQSTHGSFCLNSTDASLAVDAQSPDPARNLISINISAPAEVYQCQTILEPQGADSYARLPSLGTPQGVTVLNNTGSGLSYYIDSSSSASGGAIITSDLSLTDIAAGYNNQLSALGWTSVSSEVGSSMALSIWTFTDETGKAWNGTFMLSSTHNPKVYNALIYVED